MKGWVKIYRELQEWEWYTKPEMVHLYIHLLLSANHTTVKWQGSTIKRGQLVTSVAQLAKNTGLSVQSVRTCLNRLKSTNEIAIETTKMYTLITICKYGRYIGNESNSNKASNKASNKQPTKQKQSVNKRLTTNKNDKNDIYTHTQYNYLVETITRERADTRESVQRMVALAGELKRRRMENEEDRVAYQALSNIERGFLIFWGNHPHLMEMFDSSLNYSDFVWINDRYEVSDIQRVIEAMSNKLPIKEKRLGSFLATFKQWAVSDYQIAEKKRLGNAKYA